MFSFFSRKNAKKKEPRRSLSFESLDKREVMAANVMATLTNGLLTIEGRQANDTIVVRNDGAKVSVDGVKISQYSSIGFTPQANVPLSSVKSVVINGLEGDDTIKMVESGTGSSHPIPMTVNGGWGNDTIVGGSAADRLNGFAAQDDVAARYDNSLGLYVANDGEHLNAGGKQEKWLKSANTGWYFITPDGSLYNQTVYGQAVGNLICKFDPSYYEDLPQLAEAGSGPQARELDKTYDLFTYGDLYQNAGGKNEKWLQSAGGQWYFILPDGGVYRQTVYGQAVGTLAAQLDPSYYDHLNLVNSGASYDYDADTISGGGANDYIYGGTDVDTLIGGVGGDRIYAGAGNDTVWGGAKDNVGMSDVNDDDFIYGEDGNDTLHGGGGVDYLYGWTGNDTLYGDAGNDWLYGEQDTDYLYGWTGSDTLRGGPNRDFLYGEQDGDWLYGDEGNDELHGGDNTDYLYGWTGNDTLYGDAGDDWLYGEQDSDTLYGWIGSDHLYGAEGDDKLYGEQDTDYLYGWTGSDTLRGGPGDDHLYGEQDPDWLYGDENNDDLHGGPGDDHLYGWTGDDKLYGDEDNDELYGEQDSDSLYGWTGTDTLRGGPGDDHLFGEQDSDWLYGDENNDDLHGGPGDDHLYGWTGNDTLYGGAGNDKLFGEDGNDGLFGGVGWVDELTGGGGSDRFLRSDEDVSTDRTPDVDALLRFVGDGTAVWNDGEIELLDKGLGWLHQIRGNASLINWNGDDEQTIERVLGFEESATKLADNNSEGRIRVGNRAFAVGLPADATIVHEIGHNFDNESPIWDEWQGMSGWDHLGLFEGVDNGQLKSLDGDWAYDANASFARVDSGPLDSYGRTNPEEDWSTFWEAAYIDQTRAAGDPVRNIYNFGVAGFQAKLARVERFIQFGS